MTLYSIDTGYACFGIIEDNGVVKQTAPIANWALGKKIETILSYFKDKKHAIIIKI